jgi:5-amino-6-(5-phosphoribosylamino)uracil reductase
VPAVADRPYTLLSCSISLDGYLDDASDHRLLLSNTADLDRVDAVRATCDAIMVGAATVRNDNPRLLVRSDARRDDRAAQGLPTTPTKVTVTAGGRLDPAAHFFTLGECDKLVYCPGDSAAVVAATLGECATVVPTAAGDDVDMAWLSEDLAARGVRRLMVEGGGTLHTQFLTAGLADELHLVVAPFFVGDSRAKKFVGDGDFPWTTGSRATLHDVTRIDDLVLLRYALSERFAGD